MGWWLRALLVSLAGCGARVVLPPPPPPLAHQGTQRGRPPVLATLQRTGCFAGCPVYRVTVYRDGRVEYHGDSFVKQTGDGTGRLAPSELAELAAAFEEADFFTMADAYARAASSDVPTTTTSFAAGGHRKRVVHDHGDHAAPARLSRLEDRVDEIVHSERWVGTSSEREAIAQREGW